MGRTRFLLLWLAGAAIASGQNEPPLRPGFGPLILPGTDTVWGQLAVGDLYGDGKKEIVLTTKNRQLWVIKPDGSVPAPWPIALPAESTSAPAIGFVANKPGTPGAHPDIVVSYGTTTDTTNPGGVKAFTNAGVPLWTFTTGINPGHTVPEGVASSPVIADVDQDGWNEVVFGAFDYGIYMLNGQTGVPKPGFPYNNHDTIHSTPAVADLLGDGRKEIVIGADRSNNGFLFCGVSQNGGLVHALLANGQELPGWPQCVDQVVYSSPAIGDIDGDGKPEVVVGEGTYFPSVGFKVFAFHGNGSTVAGWPVTTTGNTSWPSSVALADLNGDGVLDVVAVDDANFLYAWNGQGQPIFKMQPCTFFGCIATPPTRPIVADVTGDGVPEILATLNTEITVVSNTGVQISDDGTHGTKQSWYVSNPAMSVLVTDLDGDHTIDVIAGTSNNPPNNAAIWVWNPATVSTTAESCAWPMFHHDVQRVGYRSGSSACDYPIPSATARKFYSITPCRAVDTRNPDGPAGGPTLFGGDQRTFGFDGGCVSQVPSDAVAVALNVTAINPTGAGDLRLFPAGSSVPSTSTINFRAGRTRANNAIIPVGGSPPHLTVQCDAAPLALVNMAIDINGYFR